MIIFRIFFLLLLIPVFVLPAFAVVDNFTTDKSLYHQGDQLKISGIVSHDPKIPFVTIQVFTPGRSNFADFNTIPVIQTVVFLLPLMLAVQLGYLMEFTQSR